MDIRYKAAGTLLLIAPFIGEGLSTSTPFFGFLNLLNLLLLIMLYGFGALIIRELSLKWFEKNNWKAIFLLGVAYGIIEEGLYLLSFFNPNWMDIEILGIYGRMWGVNWGWAMHLTLFHALFSITIPIILTYLLFPELQNERWVSDRILNKLIMIFVFGGSIWLLFVTNEYGYIPNYPEYLFFLVAVIVIVYAVKVKGNKLYLHSADKEVSIFIYTLVAGLTSIIYFIFPFIAYQWRVPALVEIILQPLFLLTMLYWLTLRLSEGGKIRYKYAFAGSFGLLTFCFILLLGTDIFSQIAFIGISILIFVLIWRKHKTIKVIEDPLPIGFDN